MNAREDRVFGQLVKAEALVVGVAGRVGRIDDALVERRVDFRERNGGRRGVHAAEHFGGQAFRRADFHAFEIGDAADRLGGDQRFLGERTAADDVDLAAVVFVIELLQHFLAAAEAAEHLHLLCRVVARDQIAQQRVALVLAREVGNGVQVALKDTGGNRARRFAMGHYRFGRQNLHLDIAVGHRLQLRHPYLVQVIEREAAGRHGGLQFENGLGLRAGGDGHGCNGCNTQC